LPDPDLDAWWGRPRVRRLDNGLTVALLEDAAAPVVSTALWYPVGTAHEPASQEGIAHFLEHMMFKGAGRFGAGDIDLETLRVGGSNNAFTSHDSTVYVFNLPREHWRLALEVESERLRGLDLDAAAVAAERDVIREEIGEVEDDPWDALELAVLEAFYGDHPYGRRILGRDGTLAGLGATELRAFHATACAAGGAVLALAGCVGVEVLDVAADLFAGAPAGVARDPLPVPEPPFGLRHLRLPQGDVRRGLLALPAPSATDVAFVHLRLALTALAGGRSSVLQRRLVDEGNLCQSVSSGLLETVQAGAATLAVEALPEAAIETIEAVLLTELERARRDGFGDEELARARRLLEADWLFAHETIEARGATLGAGLALFGGDHAAAQWRALQTADAGDVGRAARRYFDPERSGVIGWSGV
jgi:zinc protease